jgi:hypothetical protein
LRYQNNNTVLYLRKNINLKLFIMNFKKLLFAALIVLAANATFAQDTNVDSHTVTIGIPEVALLDLESATGNAITLQGTAPTEAGEAASFNASNSDVWINYSSIVGSVTEPSRNVTVQITDGDVPNGLVLSVLASQDNGQGDGTMGTANAAAIELSTTTADKIIDGVGSSYTGNGANKGHNLTYSLALDTAAGSYAQVDFDQATVLTVTYTLSDN